MPFFGTRRDRAVVLWSLAMAAERISGLLVALIVFVCLSAILAIAAFCFYQRATYLQTAHAVAQEQHKEAEQRARDAIDKIIKLKELIGYPQYETNQIGSPDDPPGEQGATLMSRINYDLQKYAAPNERSYQAALERMELTVAELGEQLEAANHIYAELEKEFNLKRTVESQRISVAERSFKLADEDLQNVKQAADQELKQQLEAYNQLRQMAAAARNLETQRRRELEAHQSYSDREINKLTQAIREHKEKLRTLESVGVPAGMVVDIEHPRAFSRSEQRLVVAAPNTEGYVYLNIGEANGVPLRTTFSVWDPDEVATPYWQERNKQAGQQAEEQLELTRRFLTAHKQSGPKAAVEVIEILGPHLSKALIIDSQLDNPVAPGDKIYSPVFIPGQTVRVALVGTFDLDGEGGDDRDLFMEILRAQGAIVEAITNDQGELVVLDKGQKQNGPPISAETDWVIEGEISTDITSPDQKEKQYAFKVSRARNTLRQLADRLGVKVIDQESFLSFMGLGSQDYTYNPGGYAGGPYPGRRFENPAHRTQPRSLGSRRIRARPEEVIHSVTRARAD